MSEIYEVTLDDAFFDHPKVQFLKSMSNNHFLDYYTLLTECAKYQQDVYHKEELQRFVAPSRTKDLVQHGYLKRVDDFYGVMVFHELAHYIHIKKVINDGKI